MTEQFNLAKQLSVAIVSLCPRRAAATVGLTLLVGLVEGSGLLALVPMLQLVGLNADGSSLGSIMGAFRSVAGKVGLDLTLPLVLALYVGIVGIQALLVRQHSVLQTALREDIAHVLRARLYRAIRETSWALFSRMRASTFNELLTQRVDRVASATHCLLDLCVTSVIVGVYIAMAIRVSPAMSFFVIGIGGLLGVLLRSQLASARRAGEIYGTASGRFYDAAADHLDSMKLTRCYHAVERHAGHFERLSRELGEASRGANGVAIATRQWLTFSSAALLAVIVYIAVTVARMPAAAVLLLLFLFARLVPRVISLYETAQMLATELPALEAVLDAEKVCVTGAEPPPRRLEPVTFAHAIECQDVAFSYWGDERAALVSVNIRMSARTTVAIVGPSGGGKSTVADVLMGLLVPQRGRVTIDGLALSPEGLASWRGQIGCVSQDTFLFHDTIRANLLWANPAATDEDLWVALGQAAADDFVRKLPAGLDTVVGDRGATLSGGERQRLSLARALVRRPKLLLLDEATSSLDSENEARIQRAIERLHGRITIVQITHRLSAIRHADVIHVLDEGRVIESGSWNELVTRRDGRLRALAHAQDLACPSDGPSPHFVVHQDNRFEVQTA